MLIVEQNAALALDLAEHAYLLETGRIVMAGPAARDRPGRSGAPLVSGVLRLNKENLVDFGKYRLHLVIPAKAGIQSGSALPVNPGPPPSRG